jgi:hypothetical protein
MKRTFGLIIGVLLLFFTAGVWAQKTKKKSTTAKVTDKVEKKKTVKEYKNYKMPISVYLGHSAINGGIVPKLLFDSLMKQGLSGKDSSGVVYKVLAFDFTYAERNVYEDSTGSPIVLSDYMIEHCNGDTVSATIAGSLYLRTKAGDTVYFDQVQLLRPDSVGAAGKGLKVVIGK